ncbi:hypothetical protein PIROE2DRAFT_12879, partial [Piromyces sp. E2]
MILFLIFVYLFSFIDALCNIINNKNEFISKINENAEIYNIQNEIVFDNHDIININSRKVSFIGNSNDSIIKFLNTSSINISFHENCDDIEIRNMNIIGNFKFNNNKSIKFVNVTYNGFFISNNKILTNNSTIQISSSKFQLSNEYNGYEIYNYNVDIKNSSFYGNNNYNLFLMKIENEENNFRNSNINYSFFTGNYCNSAVSISYSNIICTYTKFEKFFSGRELNSGGALNLFYTRNVFNNTDFEDNYSEGDGGSISFKYSIDTEIHIMSFKNTTSTVS